MLKIDKKLIAFTNCISCNKHFGMAEIEAAQPIKKTVEGVILHITCNRCQSSMLLGVVNGKVTGIVGVATDLTINDIDDKIHSRRITSDELIHLSDVINKIK